MRRLAPLILLLPLLGFAPEVRVESVEYASPLARVKVEPGPDGAVKVTITTDAETVVVLVGGDDAPTPDPDNPTPDPMAEAFAAALQGLGVDGRDYVLRMLALYAAEAQTLARAGKLTTAPDVIGYVAAKASATLVGARPDAVAAAVAAVESVRPAKDAVDAADSLRRMAEEMLR